MKKFYLLLISFLTNVIAFGQAGQFDPSFVCGNPAFYYTYSGVQSDGNLLVGNGSVENNNREQTHQIFRFLPNGNIDNTFNAVLALGDPDYTTYDRLGILAIKVLPDDRILVGGAFENIRNPNLPDQQPSPCLNLARLLPNGVIDLTFNYNQENFIDAVATIFVNSANEVIIGGHRILSRILDNGDVDETFADNFNFFFSTIETIDQFSNGKYLVGGNLTTAYNSYLMRLLPDGNPDTSWTSGSGFNGKVKKVIIQPDQKILVMGNFTQFNGTPANRICRLNEDGTLDTTFNIGTGPNSSASLRDMLLQPDGKIVLAGKQVYSFNGIARKSTVRLNPDGSVDTTYGETGHIRSGNADYPGAIESLIQLPDSKIIASGYFMGYEFNTGTLFNSIGVIRLLSCTNSTETQTINACESYTWIDGNTYTENNNTATHTYTSLEGCSITATLDLTIVPPCIQPSIIATSNVSPTSATINWNASSSNPANGYEWEVRTSGLGGSGASGLAAFGTTSLGTNTASVSGLNENTPYTVYVRSNCGSGEFSIWTSGGSFTTLQFPATLPYFNNFDSSNDFLFINGSQTNRWFYGSAVGNSGSSIYISNNSGVSNNYSVFSTSLVFAYREFAIPAGATLATLGFDWRSVGENNFDYLRVWLVPSSFNPVAGTAITSGSDRIQIGGNYQLQNNWQSVNDAIINVSGFAGQSMKLVFEWRNDDSDGTNPPVAIDNVFLGFSSTIWNGLAWSNGEPTSTKNAIIQGDYTTTANLEANTLTVDSGVFTIASGTSVTVEGAVVNNAAATNFIVENNGNLLQNASAANVGAITVRANSQPLMRLDYTLWSSPVAGQNLKAFSPNTLSPRFYVYDETATTGNSSSNNGTYVTVLNETNEATYNFVATQGYLIRTPNNHPTTPTVYNGVFTGVPQNGNYSATLSNVNAGYNLVGNPYPSSIDLNAFFTGNAAIENTVWFWRKTNGAAGDGYVTANNLGYTFPGQSADGATNIGIRSGQGFFVKATGAGTVSFTNGMRATNTTSTFFRNATVSETPSRIWLQVANSTEVLASALVGYTSAATLGVDAGFDSKPFGASSLVSLIGTEGYAIQGRSSFEVTDQVALGFEATTAGNYSIAIANKDGVFASGQAIYLQDLAQNITHDFANGAYQFVSEAGTFNNRFKMVYENETLGIDDVVANQAYVYNNNGVLTVASTRNEIKSVVIFDIQGRVLQSASNVNANQWQAQTMAQKNQVLLVQVTTAAGVSTTKTVF
jgi:uncharacterized delta-60 repeat protein